MTHKLLFVTGLYRSGTTFLYNLVNLHPDINIDYQNNFSKFNQIKKRFFKQIKYDENYFYLNHLFNESKYSNDDLNYFLIKNDFIASFQTNQRAKYAGSKEIIIEEFIPYLLSQKTKIILIIRDIRNVICSCNFANAERYIGAVRPTLFNIHNWRKSVAFALKYSDSIQVVKYEDLVVKPDYALEEICKYLEIKNIYNRNFLAKNLAEIKMNSSFNTQKDNSATKQDRYKNLLSKQQIAEIESCCFAELVSLNYKVNTPKSDLKEIIKNYQESFTVTHNSLTQDYADKYLRNELYRLELLSNNKPDPADITKNFIYAESYKQLRKNFINN